ncbi:MAG: DUF2865 domain-containing protein [Roseiarcus sp.]
MRSIIGLGAVVLASLAAVDSAEPQSVDCARLQQAIAVAGRGAGPNAQFEAAAQKQRSEIERTAVYARSIGCQNHKFLFLGSDPPPQCEQINAQLSKMQANLGELQARAGGSDGGREQLVARYNAECAAPARPRGLFDALFGNPSQPASPDLQTVPLAPEADANPDETTVEGEKEAHAGSKAVCVRTCDGSFFPVSYSAGGGRLDELQDMCRALCPNADVSLYTYSPSSDIDTAVSISGARYMDSPNALKYRKSLDSTCSCRKRGQSWAAALAGAEQRLGGGGKSDIIVTPERSVELSRPKPDAKSKPAKTTVDPAKSPPDPAKSAASAPTPDAKAAAQDQAPIDPLLGQQAATVSRETSGIAAGDATTGPLYTKGQGQTEEIVGPDGVKRRVRIIDPTL